MAGAATLPSGDFFTGVPLSVDPEQIDRELSRLWKPVDAGPEETSAVTRACLSNIVFYLADARAWERARDFVNAVGRRFPSRMILLAHGKRNAGEPGLSAWVTAVCHLTSPGAPPVCCEQIILRAGDGSLDVFPGAVVPLLVPDVPVNLVVLGAGGEALAGLLEDVVDRVIFDSRELPLSALARVRAVLDRHAGPDRHAPCGADDLAWRDTIAWRRTICEIFDDPAARPILSTLRGVEVRHATGSPARAALVAGWLASRLARDLSIALLPVERPGPADPGHILSVHLNAGSGPGGAFLDVSLTERSSLLRIEYHTEASCVIPRTLPFRGESDADLLGAALERTTHQGVLLRAVEHLWCSKSAVADCFVAEADGVSACLPGTAQTATQASAGQGDSNLSR